MTTAASTDDESNDKKMPNKRGKTLQPLHADEIKQSLAKDKELAQTNADVLAELAAKTAALTDKLGGDEVATSKTLIIESQDNESAIIEALNADEREQKALSKEPNPAADLIRAKLQNLYKKEPDVGTEAAEAVASKHRSKHQAFMYELTTSGKSLAEIQTAWHNYYVALPDEEKHEVWQEFYNTQSSVSAYVRHTEQAKDENIGTKKSQRQSPKTFAETKPVAPTKSGDLKAQLLSTISAGGQLKPIHHIKSLLFGVGLAGFVGLLITFVFFNEVFIAPFISPSKTVSATPIIGQIDGSVGPEPKIIIPKINLEVPVVYGLGTIDEQAIQDGLEQGVVHYAASPEPGQQGNAVIVGHSSNNILNTGKYKFAFVLLRRLEVEDTFFVHKDGVRYTYKVYEKKVVSPDEVSVLGPADRDNTMTLITCDPPGTSLNRLVIVAEQISPDPATNTAATIDLPTLTEPVALPSNAPSLWSRLWPF